MSYFLNKVGKLILTLVSQMGWSGTSFVITLFLAKNLDTNAFGIFAIYLAVRRGVSMGTGALVLMPMTVVSGRLSRIERKQYAVSIINLLFVLQLMVGLSSVLFYILFAWQVVEATFFLTGAAAIEIVRRVDYLEGRVKRDTFGAFYHLFLTLFALLVIHDLAMLDTYNAMLVVGLINLSWLFLSTVNNGGLRKGVLKFSQMKELWRIGSWGLGGNAGTYIYSEASTMYTYALIGTHGVAILELGRQFVAVLQPLLFGMANYLQPKLAISAANDKRSIFIRKLINISLVQVIFAATILVLMLILSPYLIGIIVPDKVEFYKAALPIVSILAISSLLRVCWQQPTFAMVALGWAKHGFFTRILAAMIALPAGYLLTYQFGIEGAAWTNVVGDGVMLFFSVCFLFRLLNGSKREEQE